MTKKELIAREIEDVPEALLGRVLEFVRLLKTRVAEKLELTALSESSLQKDWLRPEEEKAWRNL